MFGFDDIQDQNYFLFNHLLSMFTYNIYNSRVNNNLNFQSLKCAVPGIKCIKVAVSNDDITKKGKISSKWKLVDKLI